MIHENPEYDVIFLTKCIHQYCLIYLPECYFDIKLFALIIIFSAYIETVNK